MDLDSSALANSNKAETTTKTWKSKNQFDDDVPINDGSALIATKT
jgi:hypothetical protein